jgi:hypothetical protein
MRRKEKVILIWRPSATDQKPPRHPVCPPSCKEGIAPPGEIKKLIADLANKKSLPSSAIHSMPKVRRIDFSAPADEEFFARIFAAKRKKVNKTTSP